MTEDIFQEAREKNDIINYVMTRTSIHITRQGSRYLMGFCPFHQNDRSEAFAVYSESQHFHCFSASCGESGSVIDLHMKLNGFKDAREAALDLLGNPEVQKTRRPAPKRTEKPKETWREFSKDDVDIMADNLGLVMPELAERGVTQETANDFMVGAKYGYGEYSSESPLAQEFHLPPMRRIVLPRVWFGQVLGVETRLTRDMDDVWNGLDLRTIDAMRISHADYANEKAAREAAEKGLPLPRPILPENVTDEALKRALFGPRYHSWSKSHNHVHNAQAVVRKRIDDGALWYPQLNAVIITEGVICELSLRDVFGDDGGYLAMAIKAKHDLDLRRMFQRVQVVWIVADNDPPKRLANGMTSIQGLKNATQIAGLINGWRDRLKTVPLPGKAKIIAPPPDFQDSNDVVRLGGPEEVLRWLSPYVEPMTREKLREVQSTVRAL